ncbi:MAG TPA: HDOD domain-containing protein [Steroidobacteraceae bacterium]|nr:HDOD domain-containing protein [Steroidobacteraceae bacterium]
MVGSRAKKRILFVDDDPQLLDGLRRRLSAHSPDWEMIFVASAEQALQELERSPCDVIVSDVRMPGLAGTELLRRASEHWPDAVRIALTGAADLTDAIALVPIAHQYLKKPCPPEQLEQVIERCLKLQNVLGEPSLRRLIGRIRRLPTQPRVSTKLQVTTANDAVTPQALGKIISTDAVITAKVLQIVNSSFFRPARRISNIEQAVQYMGFTGVRNLIMCTEVFARWPGKLASAAVDLELVQQHAQRTAAITAALTAGTVWRDDAVLAALLHDIGYWVLVQECPGELAQALEVAVRESVPIHVGEARVIGASHAEVGAYLLGLWGLPYGVIDAVAHHHAPERARSAKFDVLSALAVSIALCGTDDGDVFRIAPPRGTTVGPAYLNGLWAPFTWSEAEARAVACLAEPEGARAAKS